MKRRHYPKKLKVKKRYYKVEMTSRIEDDKGQDMGLFGCLIPQEKLILLNTRQSDKEMFKTLLHEALHAIEVEYKIRIPHKLIYAMEGPLAEFIKANFFLIPRR
jgi:hypothetical protein